MNRHPVLEEYWRLQETRRQVAEAARSADPVGYQRRIATVLNSAHRQIAQVLAEDGFRFNPRRRWLSRRADGLLHRIAFTTSDANVPDSFIALYPHFWVMFPAIAAWRYASGRGRSPYVSIRHLSGFEADRASIEHDIGPPATRAADLQDLLHRLRYQALPYFDNFRDLATTLETARNWPRDGFAFYEVGSAIEVALYLGQRDVAQAIVNHFFVLRPELLTSYWEFTSGARIHHSADGPDRFSHDVAALVRTFHLAHPSPAG